MALVTGYIVVWQEEIRNRRLLVESSPSRARLLRREAATSNEEIFLREISKASDSSAKTAEERPTPIGQSLLNYR